MPRSPNNPHQKRDTKAPERGTSYSGHKVPMKRLKAWMGEAGGSVFREMVRNQARAKRRGGSSD